ncbi:MAG: hypothetical protein QOF72_672, partial [Blastocatellia bacterium]|nr:hypothetical protein [Blastocatellia bacterium]
MRSIRVLEEDIRSDGRIRELLYSLGKYL